METEILFKDLEVGAWMRSVHGAAQKLSEAKRIDSHNSDTGYSEYEARFLTESGVLSMGIGGPNSGCHPCAEPEWFARKRKSLEDNESGVSGG